MKCSEHTTNSEKILSKPRPYDSSRVRFINSSVTTYKRHETFADAVYILHNRERKEENIYWEICVFVVTVAHNSCLSEYNVTSGLAQIRFPAYRTRSRPTPPRKSIETKHWWHFPNDFCVVKVDFNDKESSKLSRILFGQSVMSWWSTSLPNLLSPQAGHSCKTRVSMPAIPVVRGFPARSFISCTCRGESKVRSKLS